MYKYIRIFLLLFILFSSTYTILYAQKHEVKKIQKIRENDSREAQFNKLFIEANLHKNRGEYTEALNIYFDCLSYVKNSAAVYYEIAQIYVEQNNYTEAETYAHKALQLKPDEAMLYELLSTIYAHTGNTKKQIATLEKIAKENPNPQIFISIADVYRAEKKYSKALQSLEKAEKNSALRETIIQKKIQILCEDTQYKKAEEVLKTAIVTFPHNTKYQYQLAQLYYKNEQFSQAIDTYNTIPLFNRYRDSATAQKIEIYALLDSISRVEQTLTELFRSQTADNELKNSILTKYIIDAPESTETDAQKNKIIRNLLEEFPQDEILLKYAAETYYANPNNHTKAKKLYYTQLKQGETEQNIYSRIIKLEKVDNNWDSIIYVAQNAYSLYPLQAEFPISIAESYSMLHEYEEAQKYLDSIQTFLFQKSEKAAYYSWLAFSYFKQGDSTHAIKHFNQAAQLDSTQYDRRQRYAYFLAEKNDNQAYADILLQKCITEKPQDIHNKYIKAKLLFNDNNILESKKITKGLLAHYEHADYLELYGDILSVEGHQKEASDYWKQAEELGNHINIQRKTLLLQKKNK
ncbi:MAG: tetratricopeptide repeat protein [Bacteroidota bacterium]